MSIAANSKEHFMTYIGITRFEKKKIKYTNFIQAGYNQITAVILLKVLKVFDYPCLSTS